METKLPVFFEMIASVVNNNSNNNSFILLDVCHHLGAFMISHICAALAEISNQVCTDVPWGPQSAPSIKSITGEESWDSSHFIPCRDHWWLSIRSYWRSNKCRTECCPSYCWREKPQRKLQKKMLVLGPCWEVKDRHIRTDHCGYRFVSFFQEFWGALK